MDSLINVESRTWNLQVIQTLVDPQDEELIESIPLSRFLSSDRDRWYFTNTGRYTVKSKYQLERVYSDGERMSHEYGPSDNPLKAHCWKVRCYLK